MPGFVCIDTTDDRPIDTVTGLVATLEEDDQADSESGGCPEFWHCLSRYAEKVIVRYSLDDYFFHFESSGFLVCHIVVERSHVLLWSHCGMQEHLDTV